MCINISECPDVEQARYCKDNGCFIPYNHADFDVLGCISFEEAENLLNHKNNDDEDIDPGKGVLRMHQAGHKPHEYQEPESYYWSNLRRTNSIQDILLAISAALGYENDEKRDFVINNQWNEPKSLKVSSSVNGFCRAILEIPFSRQVLRKAKQQNAETQDVQTYPSRNGTRILKLFSKYCILNCHVSDGGTSPLRSNPNSGW
uniref:Uncharacterized protein n=1 Tax=Romanomermis culicivorax TaxID=13658 RepID=A0A915LCM4_ROMCU